MLPTYEEIEKVRWDDHEKFLQNYFMEDGMSVFAGSWDQSREQICDIERLLIFRLKDGRDVVIGSEYFGKNNPTHSHGFSIRLYNRE